MVSEELIERLRKLHDTIEEMEPFSIPQLAEAADTIEAQAAEIERLKVECQAQYHRGYYDGGFGK